MSTRRADAGWVRLGLVAAMFAIGLGSPGAVDVAAAQEAGRSVTAPDAGRSAAAPDAGRSAAAEAPSGILAFHDLARERALAGADEKTLVVVCADIVRGDSGSPDLNGMWLSFLATQPGRIEIAALTRAAIAAPADVIASRPRFNPLPTGLTGRAGTLDWGWLYDRNGDGRVDYLLQLQNAHPLLPEPLPADFPTVELLPDGRVRLTRELAYAMIDHAQMVFRHYADDAFAGAVDAIVVEEFDAQWPMFVSGFVAYLAAREGREESAWAFRSAIAEHRRDLARDPQRGIMLPTPTPGRLEPAAARLAQGSRLLRLINDALARCPASAGAVAAPEKGSGSISRLPFGK